MAPVGKGVPNVDCESELTKLVYDATLANRNLCEIRTLANIEVMLLDKSSLSLQRNPVIKST